MKEFYQYYIRYFSEYSADEEEAEGIVCANSFMDALNEVNELCGKITRIELESLGTCLDKDMVKMLTWRADDTYTVFDDCDSCKI